MDCWTSKNQHPFLTITGHYIDDAWVMHRQLVGFEHFDCAHTGEAIAKMVQHVLVKNDILEKFMGLTGDSASNNTKASELLGDILADSHNYEWSCSENYFHCASHVFNLVAQAVCEPFAFKVKVGRTGQVVSVDVEVPEATPPPNEVFAALAKISAVARVLHQSNNIWSRWKQLCEKNYPSQAVCTLITAAPTRWNSRYQQIERVFRYRMCYQDITISEPSLRDYHLTKEEWVLLEWLHRVLFHINICSHYVGITRSPAIGYMIPSFGRLMDMLESDLDLEIKEEEKRKLEGAMKAASAKLKRYYLHTVTNPYYTFGLSKFSSFFYKSSLTHARCASS